MSEVRPTVRHKIGLGYEFSHQPFAEFIDAKGDWLIWLSYNKDATAGTYLRLYSDGRVTRETLEPTGEIACIVEIIS